MLGTKSDGDQERGFGRRNGNRLNNFHRYAGTTGVDVGKGPTITPLVLAAKIPA
jgi:hypothetical protein